MSKARSMYAGSSGYNYSVNKNSPGNGNHKWQGLPPTVGHARNARHINIEAGGNNRDVIFCMNQLGGVGRISTMFATTADGVKDCKNNVRFDLRRYRDRDSCAGGCPAALAIALCLNENACGNTRCAFNSAFTAAFDSALIEDPALLIDFFEASACGAIFGTLVNALVSAIEAAAPGISQLELCGGAVLSDVISTGICFILTQKKEEASKESAADFSANMLKAIAEGILFDEISSYLAQAFICGKIAQPCPWM